MCALRPHSCSKSSLRLHRASDCASIRFAPELSLVLQHRHSAVPEFLASAAWLATPLSFSRTRHSPCSGAEGCRCWAQNLQQQLPPEQLAYIAALAVGSPLVFGDVPMATTLQRLLFWPSIQELDAAFGTQVCNQIAVETSLLGSVGDVPISRGLVLEPAQHCAIKPQAFYCPSNHACQAHPCLIGLAVSAHAGAGFLAAMLACRPC